MKDKLIEYIMFFTNRNVLDHIVFYLDLNANHIRQDDGQYFWKILSLTVY